MPAGRPAHAAICRSIPQPRVSRSMVTIHASCTLCLILCSLLVFDCAVASVLDRLLAHDPRRRGPERATTQDDSVAPCNARYQLKCSTIACAAVSGEHQADHCMCTPSSNGRRFGYAACSLAAVRPCNQYQRFVTHSCQSHAFASVCPCHLAQCLLAARRHNASISFSLLKMHEVHGWWLLAVS